MIAALHSAYRTLRARARLLWSWARRHPKMAILLAIIICWLVSAIAAVPAAYADGTAGSSAPPYMPPIDLKDSNGVPLWRYAILPIDRGDILHPVTMYISNWVDGIWTFNIAAFAWCTWSLAFLLQFTWVDWIAAPVDALAHTVQSIVGQLGWPVLALMLAGGVFGITLAFGRFARGAVDLGVSILCFVLATGVLANPVATLTGEHGALAVAESTGANLAASVLSTDGADPTGTPSKADAQKLISQSLMGGLIDVFVRLPAQEITFGHTLSGQCDAIFTAQIQSVSAFDTGSTVVRDAVGKCDKDAQEYVTHTSPAQIMTALTVTAGSAVLLVIAEVIALAALVSVFYALYNALKLTVNVYLAMAPGVARGALWKSLIGSYVGALMLAFTIVSLAVYLQVLQSVMKAASHAGLTITAQTTVIVIIVIALIITLIVGIVRARRSGKRLASWLTSLGRGGAAQQRQMSPLMKEGLRTAGQYAANRLSQPRSQRELPAKPSAPIEAGEFTATPARRTGPAAAVKVASTAVRTASAVAQLGAAASTGGASTLVIKAAQIGGKRVLQRHTLSAMTGMTGKVLEHKTARPQPSSSQSMPYGRQIVVDRTGVGKIAPAAQDRGGAYQVTQLRPRPVSGSPLRAALEAASKGSAV